LQAEKKSVRSACYFCVNTMSANWPACLSGCQQTARRELWRQGFTSPQRIGAG
jgi:Fe-S-cluster-containing dehydrogenase component